MGAAIGASEEVSTGDMVTLIRYLTLVHYVAYLMRIRTIL